MKLLVLLATVTIVASRSSHPPPPSEGQGDLVENLMKLKELLLDKVKARGGGGGNSGGGGGGGSEEAVETPKDDRKSKSLNFYSYFPPSPLVHVNFPPAPPPPPSLGYYSQGKDFRPVIPEEWLSRTEPFKRKTTHLIDSPTYYIRLPPNPYVFVPGVGYVSRPPSMNDPEVLNTIQPGNPDKSPDILPNQFYHVPINFVSNGKPTSVFQLPNDHARPKPEPSILSLNKGPYLFNGKPSDIYLLRNSFNSLYADALTNFYP